MDHPMNDDTYRVADDLAIRQVLARYARSVDRMDPESLLDCYHPGAPDHHGLFDGPAEEFVPWCMAEVAKYTMTFHLLAQTAIEFDDDDPDVARVETYAIAIHRREGGRRSENWQTGCRYVDRFERRPSPPSGAPRWRIAERWVVGDWLSIDPTEAHRAFGPEMIHGIRGPQRIGEIRLASEQPPT